MKLNLHTVSRDNLFDAKATYEDGKVKVLKGSRINLGFSKAFKPSEIVKNAINDRALVGEDGVLKKDTRAAHSFRRKPARAFTGR